MFLVPRETIDRLSDRRNSTFIRSSIMFCNLACDRRLRDCRSFILLHSVWRRAAFAHPYEIILVTQVHTTLHFRTLNHHERFRITLVHFFLISQCSGCHPDGFDNGRMFYARRCPKTASWRAISQFSMGDLHSHRAVRLTGKSEYNTFCY